MSDNLEKNYIQLLADLKEKIRKARLRASFSVNKEVLFVYWEIGKLILEQKSVEGWGSKFIKRLATDLRIEFSDIKGFSDRNLTYMQTFASAYPDLFTQQAVAQMGHAENQQFIITQQAVAQIPWGHHTVILDKVKSPEERLFYITQCSLNGWNRNILIHQIESNLFGRSGALINNFSETLPAYDSELTQQIFKDPYQLDFIALGLGAKERDLENAIINHIIKFLQELGEGFALMGRQYRLEAGGQEYFLDLLFYHTRLRRHVVIELKIGEFMPEYVGKMNFYLGLVDDRLKGQYDESAIGLILCKTKNKITAEYALRDTTKPIGIAEYKIAEQLPDDIKGELPSIEEIEEILDEEIKELQSPVEYKTARLKDILNKIKGEEANVKKDEQSIIELLQKTILPLKRKIVKHFEREIIPLFKELDIVIWLGGQGYKTESEAIESLERIKYPGNMGIEIRLNGFKKAGLKAFDCYKEITLQMSPYKYSIGFKTHVEPLFEKLYHQMCSDEELESIAEKFVASMLDDILNQVENI